jgi:hypothetical protein
MSKGNWRSWLQAFTRSSSDQRRITTARKLMRSARRLFHKAADLHELAIKLAPEIMDDPPTPPPPKTFSD